jgi:hypothetical protein
MSASITVKSIRTARARKRRSRNAAAIKRPRHVVDRPLAEPPGQLADRRLVGHPLGQRNLTEPAQINRV